MMGKRYVEMTAMRAVIASLKTTLDYASHPDIDDAVLRTIAPYLFILDFEAGNPVYRMAGSAICAALGFNPHDKSFYVNWNCDAHETLDKFFRAAIADRSPFYTLSLGLRDDADPVNIETVFIPITLPEMTNGYFIGVSIPLDGDLYEASPILEQSVTHIAFLHGEQPPTTKPFPRLIYSAAP